MAFFRKIFGVGLNSEPWYIPCEDFDWTKDKYDCLLEAITDFEPRNKLSDNKFNILVIGPKGQGKSAFINSIASISINEITTVCVAAKVDDNNVTTVYRRYEIPGMFTCIRFCDVQGITKKKEEAACLLHNLRYIVQGNVKDGFKLNSLISDDSDFFIKEPTVESKMHFVIVVIDIREAYDIHCSYIENIQKLTEKLNELNVPYSVVLSTADKLCQRVQDGIENIFHSRKVITAAENTCTALGISRKNIHPVVNFEGQVKFGWKEKIPLLLAMKSCLNSARDHLYNAEKETRLP